MDGMLSIFERKRYAKIFDYHTDNIINIDKSESENEADKGNDNSAHSSNDSFNENFNQIENHQKALKSLNKAIIHSTINKTTLDDTTKKRLK